jgi:ketosteroid isomerase-like protein
MKYLHSFAFALLAFATVFDARGAESSASTEAAVKTILAIEEQRNQAILHGDVAALDRMTSDDYTFITLRGELRSKAEILRDFKAGLIKYDSRTISDLKVRVYGNAAVVTGRAIQKGMENGKDYSGDYWFTRVYVNKDGSWKTVALQTTLIQPQMPATSP